MGFSAIRCLVLLLAAFVVSRLVSRKRYGLALAAACGLNVVTWVLLDTPLIWGAFVLFLVLLVVIAVQGSGKSYLVTACVGILGMTWLVTVPVSEEVEKLRALRQEYPGLSLRSRLSYEQDRTEAHGVKSLGVAVETALDDRETEEERYNRTRAWMLERLHSETYESFVRQPGFGLSRMPRVHRSYIDLPRPEPIPVLAGGACLPNEDREPLPPPPSGRLLELLKGGRKDFLNPERMGYVRNVDFVAGFQSHRFDNALEPVAGEASDRWRVTQLQLVSLLKHETPVVYASDVLPDLERLDDVATRELDVFEAESLSQLATEKDVVTQEGGAEVRMLGSLRASNQCLQCHDVSRGTLLGALSYVLRPESGAEPATK